MPIVFFFLLIPCCIPGRNFPDNPDQDVFIQSRLNLVLPSVVDDLIPPATLINSVPVSTHSRPAWRTTLAYFVSAKLLRRLRKQGAQVRLDVATLSLDSRHEVMGTVSLDVKDAKMVLMKDGKRELREVEAYVVDKGNWLPLSPPAGTKATLSSPNPEIKAGLFVLDMPQAVSDLAAKASTPVPATFTKRALTKTDPGLELCSSSQIMEHDDNSLSQLSSEDDDDDDDDEDEDIPNPSRSSNLSVNKAKLKLSGMPRRVQSHNNIKHIATESEYVRKRYSSSASQPKVNLEKLSTAFTGMKIEPHGKPSPTNGTTTTERRRHDRTSSETSATTAASNNQIHSPSSSSSSSTLPYRQIGKGSKPITFYFNIVHADHITSLLRAKSSYARRRPRPFFRYQFLSSIITAPASSLSLIQQRQFRDSKNKVTSCFHFRGQPHDIQSWLTRQQKLVVTLIVKSDMDDEDDETIGVCEIPLSGVAFSTANGLQRAINDNEDYFYGSVEQDAIERVLPERSFPVYDLQTRELCVSAPEEIARITVRMGLVAGWWNNDATAGQREDQGRLKSHRLSWTRLSSENDHANTLKRANSNGAEQFEQLLKNKKMKRAVSEQGSPRRSSSRQQPLQQQSKFIAPRPIVPSSFSFSKSDDLSIPDSLDQHQLDMEDDPPSVNSRRLMEQRQKRLEKTLLRGHSDLGAYRERPLSSSDRKKSIDDALMPPPMTLSQHRRLNRAHTHSSSWTTDLLDPVPSLTADSDTINEDMEDPYQESLTQMYSEALDLMRDHSMRWSKVKTLVTSEVDRVLRERQRLAEFRKNIEVMLKTKRARDHGIAKPSSVNRTKLAEKRLSGSFS